MELLLKETSNNPVSISPAFPPGPWGMGAPAYPLLAMGLLYSEEQAGTSFLAVLI